MTKPADPIKLLYLDGLRALAALYVVIHHAVLQYYEMDAENLAGLSGLKKASILFAFQGGLAVDLFIVLSGFCLMLPIVKGGYHLKGGTLLFYKKRIIRIIPPYLLAMLLSMILISLFIGQKTGTHWDVSIPFTYKDVLAHVLLLHDLLLAHNAKINHSLWSISVECRIYILFPVLIYLWRKIGWFYTLIATVALSFIFYLCLLYARNFYPDVNFNTPGVNPYIILFTLGMLAADISFSANRSANWKRKLPWALLLIISIIVYLVVWKVIDHKGIPTDNFVHESIDIAFGLCCFVLLVVASTLSSQKVNFNWLQKVLAWQPLVFLGSFAYSTYLIHAPLLQVISQYLITPLHLERYPATVVMVLVSVVVILPLSYLFFILCERPFMKLGKKLSVKQAEAVAAVNPAP